MSADAAEFVVKSVQVFAQEPHHLHAKIAVLAQKLQKVFARNEGHRRFVARFGGDPIVFPAHGLAQPEHGSRTDDFQKLLLALTGRQQDANLAVLHQVNARYRGTLLKQRGAFREQPNRFNSVKGLQQIGTQLARHRRRRHNVSPPFLTPILHILGTVGCDLDHRS